ncbi:glutamine amidotransferase [Candidatus Brocadiaceae bacterium]|nr:glutamine amidotransferase [Candidatus Brocadiaceae bacterium]
MNPKIAVVDYGIGNVQSILNALAHHSVEANLTGLESEIFNSDAVILPGVGAFKKAIEELRLRNLDGILKRYVATGKPLLGICLGMQLLFEYSEEFGFSQGLDIIKGKVVKFPPSVSGKLPHVSWNSLSIVKEGSSVSPILRGIKSDDSFYFVHSFICIPDDSEAILTETVYGGVSFASMVNRGNIFGCQFHPEKSGNCGLKLLQNFIEISGLGRD